MREEAEKILSGMLISYESHLYLASYRFVLSKVSQYSIYCGTIMYPLCVCYQLNRLEMPNGQSRTKIFEYTASYAVARLIQHNYMCSLEQLCCPNGPEGSICSSINGPLGLLAVCAT